MISPDNDAEWWHWAETEVAVHMIDSAASPEEIQEIEDSVNSCDKLIPANIFTFGNT